MSNGCKYIVSSIFVALLCTVFIPAVNISSTNQDTNVQYQVAHAQDETTYEFMQPLGLPGFGGDDGVINISDDSLATYINTLIQVVIGFAILLAVVMVIAGGAEYMAARSVTNKDSAKERINKALVGLVLALSSIVILQTINPNLIEIKPLKEIDVDSGNFVGPDFDDISNFTFNPDDTGLYYCFSHDSWGSNDNACAKTKSKCSDVRESDSNSYSECEKFVYYQGGYANAENAEACFATKSSSPDPSQPPQYGVNCYSSTSQCNNERSDYVNIYPESDPETECKAPSNFEDLDDGGIVIPNQYLNSYILNGNPSEQDVREQLNNASPTIYTNHGGDPDPTEGNWCETVEADYNTCTNLGGTPQSTIDTLKDFNQAFTNSSQCNSSDCHITVTGGTSWWFHGEGNTNPNNNGETHHNPAGLNEPTGAIDISLGNNIDAFIQSNTNSDGCSNGNYFLEESNHWHIVFDSPKCN